MKKLVWLPSSILFLLLALFLFNSCNRIDDPIDPQVDIDTIFPSEYIPAYPGSWWKYSDGSEITAGDYTLCDDKGRTEFDDCAIGNINLVTERKSFYVPMYNHSALFDHYGTFPRSGNCHLVPLVDLDNRKDEHFIQTYEGNSTYHFDESLDTTVTISGIVFTQVKATKRYDRNSRTPKDFLDSAFTRTLYAPGVGLIRKEIKRFGSPIKQVDLIDYHINR